MLLTLNYIKMISLNRTTNDCLHDANNHDETLAKVGFALKEESLNLANYICLLSFRNILNMHRYGY